MARHPSRPHVLRTARAILGLTQKELASRIGVATVTLTRFENGEIKISPEIGRKISQETLVSFDQLMANEFPDDPRIDGREEYPLTLEHYRLLKRIQPFPMTESYQKYIDGHFKTHAAVLKALYQAATDRDKFPVLQTRITHAFADIAKDLGLNPQPVKASEVFARKPRRQDA